MNRIKISICFILLSAIFLFAQPGHGDPVVIKEIQNPIITEFRILDNKLYFFSHLSMMCSFLPKIPVFRFT